MSHQRYEQIQQKGKITHEWKKSGRGSWIGIICFHLPGKIPVYACCPFSGCFHSPSVPVSMINAVISLFVKVVKLGWTLENEAYFKGWRFRKKLLKDRREHENQRQKQGENGWQIKYADNLQSWRPLFLPLPLPWAGPATCLDQRIRNQNALEAMWWCQHPQAPCNAKNCLDGPGCRILSKNKLHICQATKSWGGLLHCDK